MNLPINHQPQHDYSWITSALLGAVLPILALSTVSSRAITHGEADGNAHPNVGAILRNFPGWGFVPDCTGILIHPRVLLTAGHCSFYIENHPAEDAFVSFDGNNVLEPSTWTRVVGAVAHPGYTGLHFGANSQQNDIGVLILEEPVEGIEPAALPPLRYLDLLKRENQLNSDTLFTVVGYGALLNWPPPEDVILDGPRRVAQSRYLALNATFLFLLENYAAGYGGTSFGDSGGPTLYTDSDGKEVLVSITSQGQRVAFGASQRVDTKIAQYFLASVLATIE